MKCRDFIFSQILFSFPSLYRTHVIYEQLGDVRNLLIGRVELALLLLEFTPPRREEANQLLCLALVAARKMRIPQEQQIKGILQHFEMDCLNLNSHN
jgi:hypothetical protein